MEAYHDSVMDTEWFQKMGIYPINFEAIDKGKFTPNEVTDSKNVFEKNVYFFALC